jgi:hypothetical protein
MCGDALMTGHHAVMCFVAWVGMSALPSPYYLFFFGFCELSSIPLAVVDFFHPKHFEALTKKEAGLPALATLNELSRYAFAALFVYCRALYFPYVYATMLMPDIMALSPTQKGQDNFTMLWGIAVSCTVLTILQLHWTMLIVGQVIKLFSGGSKDKSA